MSESAAWPLADDALQQEILDMVQQCTHYRQLKKGGKFCPRAVSLP